MKKQLRPVGQSASSKHDPGDASPRDAVAVELGVAVAVTLGVAATVGDAVDGNWEALG